MTSCPEAGRNLKEVFTHFNKDTLNGHQHWSSFFDSLAHIAPLGCLHLLLLAGKKCIDWSNSQLLWCEGAVTVWLAEYSGNADAFLKPHTKNKPNKLCWRFTQPAPGIRFTIKHGDGSLISSILTGEAANQDVHVLKGGCSKYRGWWWDSLQLTFHMMVLQRPCREACGIWVSNV